MTKQQWQDLLRSQWNKKVDDMRQILKTMESNPIQEHLRKQWNKEVENMRGVIKLMENNPISKLTELRAETDKHLAKHAKRQKRGKGEWPKSNYIKDDEWNRLEGELSAWREIDRILNGEDK